MGSYLTRCWWEHFDGKDYRLSFLVYIVGSAASGKSFVPQMDAKLAKEKLDGWHAAVNMLRSPGQ